MAGNDYFTGRLLLALPTIGDKRFERAVILLVHHDSEGALGIGIGDELAMTAGELLRAAGIDGAIAPDPLVLRGGPVEPGRGFVLHSRDWAGEDSVDAGSGDSDCPMLTGSRAILEAIALGEGPRQWQIALGYAGWGPGQLEMEIRSNTWHITTHDHDIAFCMPPPDRWDAVLRRDGIDPSRLTGITGWA